MQDLDQEHGDQCCPDLDLECIGGGSDEGVRAGAKIDLYDVLGLYWGWQVQPLPGAECFS